MWGRDLEVFQKSKGSEGLQVKIGFGLVLGFTTAAMRTESRVGEQGVCVHPCVYVYT